jgi:hypothetical protein
MTLSLMALLTGLFVVPVVLLWMGQRLRRRSGRWRAVFWGAVTGYVIGMVATVAAMHYPPVLWSGGWRTVLVHGGMLLGAIVGGVGGWMGGRGR